MKTLRWIGIALAIVVVGIQFIVPEKTNPPVDESQTIHAVVDVPPEIDSILRRACYDCHSNETKWPWYSNIAPVSWLLADDVAEGRRNLNFSTFASYPRKRAEHKLDMISVNVDDGTMPLPMYLLMHPGAKLTEEERDAIYAWADEQREIVGAQTDSIAAPPSIHRAEEHEH